MAIFLVKSRVIDGKDWDEVFQDMGDTTGGYGIGTLTTIGVDAIPATSGVSAITAYATPIGIGAGIVCGGVLFVCKPFHNLFETVTDWWDIQLW